MIQSQQIKVTTTGAAGSATGSAFSAAIMGEIISLNIDYHASAPATTDITVEGLTQDSPLYTIYAKDNSVTDVFVSPRAKMVDNAAAAITDSYDRFPVAGLVKVSLAQCDALTDAVVVTVIYDDKVPGKIQPTKTRPILA